MLKTLWVEPGDGATVGELVGAMGGLPPGFAAGGMRTSLAIVGEGKVIFDAYDRIRAIEALERVGVRIGEREGEEIVVAEVEVRLGELDESEEPEEPDYYDMARGRVEERLGGHMPNQPSMPRWPELAEKLLAAAQAVVNDVGELEEPDEEGPGPYFSVSCDVLNDLRAVVREIHREAVEVIERERSRNR